MLLVGDINAGFPSAAEGYEDRPLNLHTLLVRNPPATVYYTVTGDELCEEHVRHGSILVVDKSLTATVGKLVIIEVDGAFVVCRFKKVPCVVVGVVVGIVLRL